MFEGQKILPAIKKMKDFEKVLESDYTYIVMLDLHISQLVGVAKYAKEHNKKLLLHADMIQGLKSDKYAAEFLCQNLRPAVIWWHNGYCPKVFRYVPVQIL